MFTAVCICLSIVAWLYGMKVFASGLMAGRSILVKTGMTVLVTMWQWASASLAVQGGVSWSDRLGCPRTA